MVSTSNESVIGDRDSNRGRRWAYRARWVHQSEHRPRRRASTQGWDAHAVPESKREGVRGLGQPHRSPTRPGIWLTGPPPTRLVPAHVPDRCLATRVLKTSEPPPPVPMACQLSPRLGLTGPPPIKVFPSISQIETWPAPLFWKRMLERPSPLKSPVSDRLRGRPWIGADWPAADQLVFRPSPRSRPGRWPAWAMFVFAAGRLTKAYRSPLRAHVEGRPPKGGLESPL